MMNSVMTFLVQVAGTSFAELRRPKGQVDVATDIKFWWTS